MKLFTLVAALAFLPLAALGGEWADLSINILPRWGNDPLVLIHHQYTTTHGDTVYVDVLKFYVSGFKLLSGGKVVFEEPHSYHLVDASDNSSLHIVVHHAPTSFDAIQLNIGVDSAASVSGALGGDLDPAKGMYWAWNSGYINGKLEGRSNVCRTLHHHFEFHIGGYRGPHKTLRTIRLPVTVDHVTPQTAITINADASKWFNGRKTIDLLLENTVIIPGSEANAIADNYASMLSITKQ